MRNSVLALSFAVMATGAFAEDVVIYGATPAGFAAAVEVGRRGASAVLIEPTARIGGLTTGGLGQTDSGNTSAYGGIAMEFYRAVRAHYADRASWTRQRPEEYRPRGEFEDTWRRGEAMWTFEPSVALRILEEWERREGLRIVRNARLDRGPGGVVVEKGRIVSLRTEDGRVWKGKVFVDASYEGDLMAAAGVSYTVGREPNSLYGETLSGNQPSEGYHKFRPGVDPYVVKGDKSSGLLPGIDRAGAGRAGDGDRRVQAYCFRMCLTDDPENRIPFAKPAGYDERDYELLLRNYEAGEDRVPWINSPMPNRKTDTNNRGGFSTDFIGQNWNYPEASYEERARIEKAHLRYQQGLMWTLANHPRMPEKIRAEVSRWGTCRDEFVGERGDGWQNQLYVREARRMVGEYVMTEANCRHVVKAPRPVAMGAYGMDSHHVRRYVTPDGFVQNEGDVEVHGPGPYGIDYGALTPKRAECVNLLVPVCLSASHIAFGSIRMEPVFFALGQAAGAAASMAVAGGCAVQDVDYAKLRAGLVAPSQKVEMPAKERVVFVAAHPDDMAGEIGTALLLAHKYELHVIDFTRGGRGLGEAGHLDGSTAARRTGEEERVCKAIGAELHWVDEVDGEAFACRRACELMAKLLAELKPRAVITHWPIDCHLDHAMASVATLKAVKLAGVEPEIYFHEQDHQSRGFVPTHYVDITRVQKYKDVIIRFYECQSPEWIVGNKRLNGDFRARSVGETGRYCEAYAEYPGTVKGGGIFADFK